MSRTVSMVLLLVIAACLEVGGDALIRSGLKGAGLTRTGFFVTGAAVLFAYGVFVNVAPMDFGRLLGMYVVLFFVVAQVVNAFAFHIRPSAPIIVGGALIVAGGVVLSLWKT